MVSLARTAVAIGIDGLRCVAGWAGDNRPTRLTIFVHRLEKWITIELRGRKLFPNAADRAASYFLIPYLIPYQTDLDGG